MTQQEQVREYWLAHPNEWLTVADVAAALDISKASARTACRTLHRRGELICSQDPGWTQRRVTRAGRSGTIGLSFRTRAGFMCSSRFAAMRLPEVIWVGDKPIVGPFCSHCGNPATVHGPEGECLNYRIHPCLPSGDLPRARPSSPIPG